MLSGSVAASIVLLSISPPPSATVTPVFTASVGGSFTGVTVMAMEPVTVDVPSESETLNPSEVVSPPSCT